MKKKKGYYEIKPRKYKISGHSDKNIILDIIGTIALALIFLLVWKLRDIGFDFL